MQSSYNIAASLREQARKNPYQQAVIFPAGQHKGRVSYTQLTYLQLEMKSTSIARKLAELGIKKGTRCVLMVPPSLNFFALTFALFKLGAIPVFIDPGLGVRKIGRCLEQISPHAFIGIAKAHMARVLFRWNRANWKQIISIDSYWPGARSLDLPSHIEEAPSSHDIAHCLPEDPAAILFTSGSTGSPKAVLYTHANFTAQIELLRSTYQISPGEIDLCTFPLFALFAPALGMSAIIPDMNFTRPGRVNPDKIFEAIDNFGVENMFGSPALIRRVATEAMIRQKTLPTLKRVISAGAPVPTELAFKLSKILQGNAKLHTPYGATEALPIASIDSKVITESTAQLTKNGHGICVGYATKTLGMRTEISIIHITDQAISQWHDELLVAPGTIGEIVVKGAQVTKSYVANQHATDLAKIYIPGTSTFYHRMGDLGYIDEDGKLWYCGRKSHRVTTSDNVYFTIPCESIFNQHEKVFRSALVGIDGNAKPVICIELHDPKVSDLAKAKIKTELLELASGYQHTKDIKEVLFHPNFPVDIRHNSKIFREKLSRWAQKKCK